VDRGSFRYFHRLRVRWPEVDAQRVVFNGQYLAYFDAANSGYWRAIALPYPEAMVRLGGDTFVKKATLEYHASAGYDDFVDAGMKCARLGTSSMTFAAAFFRGQTLLATAELVYVFVDAASRRPVTVPEEIRSAIEGFEAAEPVVQVRLGAWDERGHEVRALRAADAEDPGALHAVLVDRRGAPLATGRLLVGPEGALGGVFVREAMRGGGFGRCTIEALLGAARDRDLRQVAVRPAPAERPFFERCGFRADAGEPQSLKWSW
jgi:YbgC/YbaW family acyl-CoA thioester hydrolase